MSFDRRVRTERVARGAAAAREDEDRPRTDGARRREIALRVADHGHAFEAHAETGAEPEQKSRSRLAAVATVVRPVRTVDDGGEPPAGRRDGIVHLAVDRLERREVEEPAADPRLVRRD